MVRGLIFRVLVREAASGGNVSVCVGLQFQPAPLIIAHAVADGLLSARNLFLWLPADSNCLSLHQRLGAGLTEWCVESAHGMEWNGRAAAER